MIAVALKGEVHNFDVCFQSKLPRFLIRWQTVALNLFLNSSFLYLSVPVHICTRTKIFKYGTLNLISSDSFFPPSNRYIHLPTMTMLSITLAIGFLATCSAWVSINPQISTRLNTHLCMSSGSLHSQNSCYLPLQQLDQDYHSPRIIQVR